RTLTCYRGQGARSRDTGEEDRRGPAARFTHVRRGRPGSSSAAGHSVGAGKGGGGRRPPPCAASKPGGVSAEPDHRLLVALCHRFQRLLAHLRGLVGLRGGRQGVQALLVVLLPQLPASPVAHVFVL